MSNILVIEDDSPVRAGIVAVLRRQGYGVLDTGLGADGLELAITHQPDLVLSDINLPGLNGLDLLKQLRARPELAAIPVVLMTGEMHKVNARSSMTAGADDYLPKPFTMDQMLATVRARLERQNNIQHALEAQHQAERMSAAEKIRLQTSALEAAANGIAITDRGGKIRWVNPAFTKLTGYSAAEAVGQNHRVLKSGQHPPQFYAEMWATILTGNAWHGNLINKRKDGSLYSEDMTIAPVHDAKGEIQNFIAIKHDVTKRKAMEDELQRKKAFLEAQVNSSIDGILVVDEQNRKTLQNQRMTDLLKIPQAIADDPDDERQLRWVMQTVKNPEQFLEKILFLNFHQSEISQDELELKDGTILDRYSTPVTGKDGSYYGRMWTFRDITERKHAEEKLRESQLLYHSLVEQLPQSIFRLDRAARITFANSRYCELMHCQLKDLLGKTDTDLFPAELAAQYRADSLRVMETGEVFDAIERHPGADGKVAYVQVMKYPLRTGDGQIIGLQCMFWDVTDRKQSELALAASERRYRDLFAHMNEGFAYCRMIFEDGRPTDFVYLAINDMFTTLTGLKDVVGKRASEVIPGIHESDPYLFEVYGRVAATRNPERCERFVQALQMWFDLSVYSTEPGFFVVIFDVITERKLAEEKLRQSEGDLAEGQRVAKLGSWQVDLANNQVRWSDELYRIFGIEKPAFNGTHQAFLNCVLPEDRPRVLQVNAAAKANGSSFEIEYRVQTPEGNLKLTFWR